MNDTNNSDNLDYSAPPRSFIEAIKVCFAKFVVFKGRASRSEFWWFSLAQLIFISVIGIIPGLAQILTLVILVPYCAVSVRRFHDANLNDVIYFIPFTVMFLSTVALEFGSGENALLGSLVLISSIVVLCLCALPGKKEKNKYNLPTDVGREISRAFQMIGINNNDNLDYSAPPRSFIEAIKVCFAKFADFKGRASRSEFWWFHITQLFFGFVISIFMEGLTLAMIDASNTIGLVLTVLAQVIILLAIFVPYCAVGVRRFHDINRSGAGFAIPFTVVILSMVALVFGFGDEFSLQGLAGIISIAVLCFCAIPGKKQKNEYNLPTDLVRETTS